MPDYPKDKPAPEPVDHVKMLDIRTRMFKDLLVYYGDRSCCGSSDKATEMVNMRTDEIAMQYRLVYPDRHCPYDELFQ